MSRQPWWTEADGAELAALVAELLHLLATHERTCRTCRALAEPCRLRPKVAQDPYDLAPLTAPPGFYVARRERLTEHDATCPTCRDGRPGYCAAVGEAIAVALDWRWRRGLLSRAQWLRRRRAA